MFSTDVNGTVMTFEDIDDPYFMSIYPAIKAHTITSSFGPVPLWVLYKTIEHIVRHDVPGDIAECGVWNGGSMLLAALALKHFGDLSRKLYLYDTFAGMAKPEEIDKRYDGVPALPTYEDFKAQGKNWGYGGTAEMVRTVMRTSGYPEGQVGLRRGHGGGHDPRHHGGAAQPAAARHRPLPVDLSRAQCTSIRRCRAAAS